MDKSNASLPDSVDWPEETERWFEEWRGSPSTDGWTPQQWSFLCDTAWLHARLWGDGDTTVLGELHRREAFMGLSFDKRSKSEQKKAGTASVLELAISDRNKRARRAV